MSPVVLRPLVLAFTFGALGCSSDQGASDAKRGRCEELRSHRASLLLERSAGALLPGERAKHRRGLEEAVGEGYVAACVEQRSEAYLDCALAATSREELARCSG